MSNFDPQAFLEMSIDQPLEKRPLLPVQLYMGEIIETRLASLSHQARLGAFDVRVGGDAA
jgi:hypothetical protein